MRTIQGTIKRCAAALAMATAAGAVQAEPAVLWDQSNFGIGFGPAASTTVPLNDFTLDAPTAISGFRVWMRDNTTGAINPGDGLANGVFTDFSGVLSWYLFADDNESPGALLHSGDALAPQVVDSGQNAWAPFLDDIFEVTVTFAAPLNLAAGRTWLGVREGLRGSAMDGSEVLWMSTPGMVGAQRWFFLDGQNLADLQLSGPLDAAFQILGTQQVPEPGSAALVMLALLMALAVPGGKARAAALAPLGRLMPEATRCQAPGAAGRGRTRLTRLLAGAACLIGLGAGPVQAALVDRGDGLIYDTVLDITWLADMNYAKTQFESTGGLVGTATGKMEWLQANTWANNLAYGGYIDWRLPNTVQPDPSCSLQNDEGASSGMGCTASEMGHLFYQDLGGHPGESVLDSTGDTALEMANLALFSNLQSNLYWSSTPYDPDSDFGWSFWTATGNQSALGKDFQLFAMAVRRGDSIGTVPEPSAAALALLALGLIPLSRRCGRPPRH